MRSVLRRTLLAATAAVFLVVVASGCGKDPVSPGRDWQVNNAQDTFQFQATSMENYTKTMQYSWSNSGTTASVDQSCSVTDGTATLSIRDANGTQVYSRNLGQNGSFPTAAGVAGTWTLTLSLSKTTGTLNFRAQKA
jgi:hypothetical protein